MGTVTGLLSNEPQRWAARQARRHAELEVRREAVSIATGSVTEERDADR